MVSRPREDYPMELLCHEEDHQRRGDHRLDVCDPLQPPKVVRKDRTKSWSGQDEKQKNTTYEPRKPLRRTRIKGDLDESSHHKGSGSVSSRRASSSDPNFLMGASLHSQGSRSSFGQTREERRDSHLRLSKARKHQAEKRRYQAAAQAPKSPSRPARRGSFSDSDSDSDSEMEISSSISPPLAGNYHERSPLQSYSSQVAPNARRTSCLAEQQASWKSPTSIRKVSSHSDMDAQPTRPSSSFPLEGNYHERSPPLQGFSPQGAPNARRGPMAEPQASWKSPSSIPKVSSHSDDNPDSVGRHRNCDFLPKPVLRQASYYDDSIPVAALRINGCDTLPMPAIRKESYHGSSVTSYHWDGTHRRQDYGGRGVEGNYHQQSSGNYHQGAPQRPSRGNKNAYGRYASHQPRPTRGALRSEPQLFHPEEQAPAPWSQVQPRQRSNPEFSSSAGYHRNAPMSAPHPPPRRHESVTVSSAMTVVSDVTDGCSVDDSLPVWSSYTCADEVTVAPMVPSSYERQTTWAQPPTRADTSPRRRRSDSSPRTTTTTQPLTVEIQPGFSLPLRGKDETLHALECHFVTRSTCLVCTIEVTCIADAEYVLCPTCKSISPIEENVGNGGGVGLGMIGSGSGGD